MIRKAPENMIHGLNDPLYDPIQVYKKDTKRKRKCLLSIWLLSNVVTFMLGIYAKEHWFADNCYGIYEKGHWFTDNCDDGSM